MTDAVVATELVEHWTSTPNLVQVDAPEGYCVVDWYVQFPSASPQQYATTSLVVDGAGLITGAKFLGVQGDVDYDASVVCVPKVYEDAPEIPDPPASGTATLSGGVATVSHTALTSSSRVFVQRRTAAGTTAGNVYEITSRTPSTGFTITAIILATGLTGIFDTSTVDWLVIEP